MIGLPSALGLKAAALGAGLALVVGAAGGWWTRDAFCDAAAARVAQAAAEQKAADAEAKADTLRRAMAARDAAAAADAERAAADARRLAEQEDLIRDLVDRTSAGECLPAGDAERLRELWGARPGGGPAPAGAR